MSTAQKAQLFKHIIEEFIQVEFTDTTDADGKVHGMAGVAIVLAIIARIIGAPLRRAGFSACHACTHQRAQACPGENRAII